MLKRNGGTLRLVVALAGLAAAVAGCRGDGPAASVNAPAAQRAPLPPREALIARAKALELDTPYVAPPGDALEHQTAGFAKVMCSAVFITGLDPDFAAENVGYFTGPYLERARVGKPVVDRAAREVRVTLPNGPTLTARYQQVAEKRRFIMGSSFILAANRLMRRSTESADWPSRVLAVSASRGPRRQRPYADEVVGGRRETKIQFTRATRGAATCAADRRSSSTRRPLRSVYECVD